MKSKKMPDFESGLYDSGRKTADMAVEAVGSDPERFAFLLNLCFTEPYPLCMRASRVVQLCCEKQPGLILPYINELTDKIIDSKVEGVIRNFLKIIAEFVDFTRVKDNAALLQVCFEWLVDHHKAVAIRYYCIAIIEKFCTYEPGLNDEFRVSLEFCIDESPTGFRNRALKVLKKIRPQ